MFIVVMNIYILWFLDVYCCHEHFYIVVLGCLLLSWTFLYCGFWMFGDVM